ncbi:MAG: hypothetical protein Phog2KO_21040 [Phototrophicaceae bacterium]
MTSLNVNDTHQGNENKRFYILVAMIFFIVIGGIMLLFAVTFINDMQTLRNVPDALWNFICGTPIDNNVTLPLLLTIAIVCFGISAGLQIWRVRLNFVDKKEL